MAKQYKKIQSKCPEALKHYMKTSQGRGTSIYWKPGMLVVLFRGQNRRSSTFYVFRLLESKFVPFRTSQIFKNKVSIYDHYIKYFYLSGYLLGLKIMFCHALLDRTLVPFIGHFQNLKQASPYYSDQRSSPGKT